MKKLFLFLILMFSAVSVFGQAKNEPRDVRSITLTPEGTKLKGEIYLKDSTGVNVIIIGDTVYFIGSGGPGGGDSSFALIQGDTITGFQNDSILMRDEIRFDSGGYFRTDVKIGGNLDINAISDTSLSTNVSLLGQTIGPSEIENRTVTQWLYPVTYGPGAMIHSNDILSADSGGAFYRGAQFKPNLWGDTVPSVIWQSVDSTGRHWIMLLYYTLDNFDSWADTAIQIWYATQSTTVDSLKIRVYQNRAQSSATAWLAATDSTASLKSGSSGAWTVFGGNWAIGGGATPTGTWTDGMVLIIRAMFSVNGTIGTAYVKMGKVRLKYNVKS